MDIKKIEELIDLVKKKEIYEVEVKSGDEKIRVSLAPAGGVQYSAPVAPTISGSASPAESNPSASGHSDANLVKSPFVGTFYEAPSPEASAFVKIGQKVAPGDVLCIVEAMKLMNQIEADKAGTIKEILVQNGEPVQFDQALFVIN